MQRLSIPMKSGQMTTRPHRRVVSTLLPLAFGLLLVFSVVRMGIGRSSLLSLAPANAEVFDLVGRRALQSFSEHFGDIPLIAERPLTLTTLLANTRGETALIILENGHRLVAYRGKLTDSEQQSLVSVGVIAEQRGNRVVLAAHQEDFSELGGNQSHFGLSAVVPGFAGFHKENGKVKGLYLSKKGFHTGMSRFFAHRLPALPAETVAYVTFSPNDAPIPRYLEALVSTGASEAMSALLREHEGSLLLTTDEAGIGYRLVVSGRVDSQVLAKVLQSSAALSAPTTKTVLLPDGSYVDELEMDTNGVVMAVEELPQGVKVRADRGDVHLIARQGAEETVITNRQALLEPSESNTLVLNCGTRADNLVLPTKLARLIAETGSTTDPLLAHMYSVSELLILGKKMSICW